MSEKFNQVLAKLVQGRKQHLEGVKDGGQMYVGVKKNDVSHKKNGECEVGGVHVGAIDDMVVEDDDLLEVHNLKPPDQVQDRNCHTGFLGMGVPGVVETQGVSTLGVDGGQGSCCWSLFLIPEVYYEFFSMEYQRGRNTHIS